MLLPIDPEIENYILTLFNSDMLITAREGFSTINLRTIKFLEKTEYINYDVLYWLYQKGLLFDFSKPDYINYVAGVICFTTKKTDEEDSVYFARFMYSIRTLSNLQPNFKNQIDIDKMVNIKKYDTGEHNYILYQKNDINLPLVLFTVSILNIKWNQNTIYTFFIYLEIFIKKQLLTQPDFCIFQYKIQNQSFIDWFFSYEVHLFMNNSEFNLTCFDLVRQIKEEKIKLKNVLYNIPISNDIIKYVVIPFSGWTIE
jgi:hypothetical protein